VEVNDRRAAAFRALQVSACAGVALLLGALSPGIPWERWPELLFFTVLTTLTLRLRIRYAGNFVGVEAAALVPAILLLGSPGAAVLICLAGDGLAKLFQRPRRLTLANAFDVAQLGLAYGAAALFARALNAAAGGWVTVAALATGVLLVFFFVNTALVFAYLELGRIVVRERMLAMVQALLASAS